MIATMRGRSRLRVAQNPAYRLARRLFFIGHSIRSYFGVTVLHGSFSSDPEHRYAHRTTPASKSAEVRVNDGWRGAPRSIHS